LGQPSRRELLRHVSQFLSGSRAPDQLRTDASKEMRAHEDFVEKGLAEPAETLFRAENLSSFDSMYLSNLRLALNVEPFRRLLAVRLLSAMADNL